MVGAVIPGATIPWNILVWNDDLLQSVIQWSVKNSEVQRCSKTIIRQLAVKYYYRNHIICKDQLLHKYVNQALKRIKALYQAETKTKIKSE